MTTWTWHEHQFRAMNTGVSLSLYSRTHKPTQILADVQGQFDSFEQRLSRFKPESELSRFNASTQAHFQASLTFISVLETALWAAQLTHGLYDPTILPALEQAGYDRSFEQLDSVQVGHTAPNQERHHYHALSINRKQRLIYKPVGLRLDLGGMGKGWTVDRVADKLQGLGPFMLNAGGDLYAYHAPPGASGWPVHLVHPCEAGKAYASLAVHHQAVATSTIVRRRWQRNGKPMHHLIDPRTQKPAQTDLLSVTVLADRTVLAEIYAKVALLLGAKQGYAYLESLPNVEAIIFTHQKELLYTSGITDKLTRIDPHGFDPEVYHGS